MNLKCAKKCIRKLFYENNILDKFTGEQKLN